MRGAERDKFIPPNLYIVGLSGQQGAGKSVLSQALLDADLGTVVENTVFVRDSIGKPLYDFWRLVLGENVDKQKTYTIGLDSHAMRFTGRQLLQNFGTEVGRAFHSDIWIWSLIQRQSRCCDNCHNKVVIIDDIRFMEERGICDMAIWLETDESLLPRQVLHTSEMSLDMLKKAADMSVRRNKDNSYSIDVGELHEKIRQQAEKHFLKKGNVK